MREVSRRLVRSVEQECKAASSNSGPSALGGGRRGRQGQGKATCCTALSDITSSTAPVVCVAGVAQCQAVSLPAAAVSLWHTQRGTPCSSFSLPMPLPLQLLLLSVIVTLPLSAVSPSPAAAPQPQDGGTVAVAAVHTVRPAHRRAGAPGQHAPGCV